MKEFWKGRNVLVTGIGGLIGSSIARRLLDEGACVTGIVREASNSHADLERHPNLTLFMGDVTNYQFLREVIASREVDTIFHMAAYAIVRIAAQDPLNAYNVNVMGTVALLEAARNVGRCRRIVAASSDKAYGDHLELPYVETFALEPRNTYDTSKACADMIARTYALNYDMPVVVTRCSNVYGPGDFNLSRIVPNTIRRLCDGKAPMLYSDIEKMEREFIYIDDVVDAYLLLGENGMEDAGEAYNIGGSGPTQIRDLVDRICVVAGYENVECEIVQRAPSFREILRQYIDATKIASAYGWAPGTSLHQGLVKTVAWYKELFKCG